MKFSDLTPDEKLIVILLELVDSAIKSREEISSTQPPTNDSLPECSDKAE